MKYYFDFDDTLVKTRQLYPFTKNNKTRQLIINSPQIVNTQPVNSNLIGLINNIKEDVVIVSNSPKPFIEAFMKKHGYPEVPIIGSVSKPCDELNLEKDAVFVGDSPKDIYFSRNHGIPCISYLEGSPFLEKQIALSRPSAVANSFSELEQLLSNSTFSDFVIEPAFNPDDYEILDNIVVEEFAYYNIGEYYKWGSPNFNSSVSPEIMMYKRSKDFTLDEIKNGVTDAYVYNGQIRRGSLYKNTVNGFFNMLKNKIDEFNLTGSVKVIGMPNSCPEQVYLFDPNHTLANVYDQSQSSRMIQRLVPVPSAHGTGIRGYNKHIGSMGIRKGLTLNYDHIVLLDDVMTTNKQMQSGASMLRNYGFQGEIHCIALAKTVHED